MATEKKFVAVLTSSPALASIIAMVLDCEENLSVQVFSRPTCLKKHMRIAPIDMIVCDYEMGENTAATLAIDLRLASEWQNFKIIALAETLSPQIRQSCRFASIDEVIVKPMSPLFVSERVLSRLNESDKRGIFKQKSRHEASNIIELFGDKSKVFREPVRPQ